MLYGGNIIIDKSFTILKPGSLGYLAFLINKSCLLDTLQFNYTTISCARSGTRIQKGLGYQSPRQVWFDFYRQAA